jgi:POT family proton-dependent oligopeptide transporter
VIFFVFAAVSGAVQQACSTLNLFADRDTRLCVAGFTFPSSWFQSVPAPLRDHLCAVLCRCGRGSAIVNRRRRQVRVRTALRRARVPPPRAGWCLANQGVHVSPLWLVGAYLLLEFGELRSAVGLSAVTKLAPHNSSA